MEQPTTPEPAALAIRAPEPEPEPAALAITRRAAGVSLTLRGRGGELEIPLELLIDGARRPAERQRTARCGNCGARLALSGDPETDHHTAMRHRVEVCERTAQAEDEHRILVDEYRRQVEAWSPDTRALMTGARPLLIGAPAAAKKPWWKFW